MFQTQAVNEAGPSALSPSSVPIYAVVVSDSPSNLRLVSRSQSQFKIEFDEPLSHGGLPITRYNVYVASASGLYTEDTSAPSKTNPSIKYYENTSVTAGVLYSFRITAVNIMGESLDSNQIQIIAANFPSKPSVPPIITSS